MWNQDKRVYVGIYGCLLSTILFISSCFAIGNKAPYLILFFLLCSFFFLGLYFKGIKFGIFITLGVITFFLICSAMGNFSESLVNNGYISKSNSKILNTWLFFGLIILISLIPRFLLRKSNPKNKYYHKNVKVERKKIINPAFKKTLKKESNDNKYILITKPNIFKVDMVYKVYKRDDSLIFFRVGGHHNEINNELFNLMPSIDEVQFLSDKNNFVIECEDIVEITFCKKHSYGRANNGTLKITLRSRNIKFLIHPNLSHEYLVSFFKNNEIELTEKI